MGTIQLKFKSLVKKISFLKSNLEYHRAEHQKRRKVFYSDLDKFMQSESFETSEEKLKNNLVNVYDRKKVIEAPKLEKQSNKLFKKVARLTHPDLNKEKEKHEMFREAKRATEEGDWFSMYEISTELGIEIDDIGEDHIAWLEQEISKLQKTISAIKNTFEWLYCNDGANKDQLLTTYCMMTCKNSKK